jgi:hypothetical protein
MAIASNYIGYKKIFLKYNLNVPNGENILGKIKTYEIVSKVVLYFSLSAIGLLLYSISQNKSNNDAGLTAAFLAMIVFIVGGLFYVIFLNLRGKYRAKLEEILFTNFLLKKVKVYFSVEELNDKTYEKFEHIAIKVANARNPNQTTIELAFAAFIENAEGVVIVNSNQTSISSGIIGKSGGRISTDIIHSAEGILINNIQNKKHEIMQDLNYYYDLKEKGAITQEEYEKKKLELLS